MGEFAYPPVNFETHPSRYVHWDLDIDGSVAKLTMHIKEDRPMWDGLYDLKLNSYDLAVDIELHDVVNRLRFEHPEVRCVVLTGAYDKIFCAGANIRFLGNAPHAFKVNFCKYTNETRCGIEDAAEELAKQDAIERREAAAKRVRKWMEERYGRLSREQRNLIDAWAGEREYSPEAWLARSRQWRGAFSEALDQRQSSGFAERVTYLLFDDTALVPEPLEAERMRNRHRWLDLAAEISAMTSERQRDHLVEYISDFAEDFEALAQR